MFDPYWVVIPGRDGPATDHFIAFNNMGLVVFCHSWTYVHRKGEKGTSYSRFFCILTPQNQVLLAL